jgi:hypothetical protein
MSEEEELFLPVFNIGEQEFPNLLEEHLNLRTKNVMDCFIEHSELFAWYATAYELSLDVEIRAKESLARLYAVVDNTSRTAAKGAGVKLTEKMVENTVITDPQYVSEQAKYLDAKRNTGLLKAAKDAMIHRRDMLIQMGATYRAEGLSDMNLKEQNYKSQRG